MEKAFIEWAHNFRLTDQGSREDAKDASVGTEARHFLRAVCAVAARCFQDFLGSIPGFRGRKTVHGAPLQDEGAEGFSLIAHFAQRLCLPALAFLWLLAVFAPSQAYAQAQLAPEIVVERAGAEIIRGGRTGPPTGEGPLGQVLPLDIRNTGTAPLIVSAFITRSHINIVGDSVLVDAASPNRFPLTVQPGDSARVDFRYATTQSGFQFSPDSVSPHSFSLRLESNDSNEGSFDLSVTSEAVVGAPNQPPIAQISVNGSVPTSLQPLSFDVRPGEDVLLSGQGRAPDFRGGSSDPDGNIVDLSWQQISGPSVALGAHNAFAPLSGVRAFAADRLAPSSEPESNTVTRVFRLTVRDAGGAVDTADVTINVIPFPPPEITVSREGDRISDNGRDNLEDAVLAGVPQRLLYTIQNAGTGPLSVSGVTASNAINIAQVQVLSVATAQVVEPGGSTQIAVDYTPARAGFFAFEIDIVSNDADRSPFDITFAGTAIAPNISVARDGAVIANRGEDAQGSVNIGATQTLTYTISNDGDASLNVSEINSVVRDNLTGAVTMSRVSLEVAPGGAETFDVSFTPELARPFAFDIIISSNDVDDSPYVIAVTGDAELVGGRTITLGADGSSERVVEGERSMRVRLALAGEPYPEGTPEAERTFRLELGAASTVDPATDLSSVRFPLEVVYPVGVRDHTFDIVTVDDDIAELTETLILEFGSASTTFEIIDNEPYAVTANPSALEITEGETATFELLLDRPFDSLNPRDFFDVDLTIEDFLSDPDGVDPNEATRDLRFGDGLVSVRQALFGVGQQIVEVPVRAISDDFVEGTETAEIRDREGGDSIRVPITILDATEAVPDISIARDDTEIADGDTDTQDVLSAGTSRTLTYTVANEGTGPLTVSGITASDEANISGPVTFSESSFTVAPDESETFTVTYTPLRAGDYAFNLDIASDDVDENPYDIAIGGTASAPEISVSRDGTLIPNLTADPQGTPMAGVEQQVTYTISNGGRDPLTVSGITTSGVLNLAGPVTFSETTFEIAPDGSDTVTVTYTPAVAGGFAFSMIIANNDADENPYNVALGGNAIAPEISVVRDGVLIADGGGDALGAVIVETAQTFLYSIENVGAVPLTVSDISASDEINVTGAVTFSETSFTVAPGGAQTVEVTFTTAEASPFSFNLDVISDDADESPYDIAVSGTATAPEISVLIEGVSIADGFVSSSAIDNVGEMQEVIITISNEGGAPLTVSDIIAANARNVDLPISFSETSFSIAPGGSETFTMTYTPTSPGAFGIELDIVSNDADENPYDILYGGTAIAPEISVSRDGSDILDGESDAQGDFSFGETQRLIYTVANEGTAPLEVTGISVSFDSAVSALRTGLSQTNFTVVPNGSQTFELLYTPEQAGDFSFDLTITSNDADESPYDITVNGTAATPEIAVSREGALIADGNTDAQGTLTAGTARTLTYTIANEGTEPLEVSAVTTRNSSNITGPVSLSESSFTVAPDASQTIDVTFTPAGAGDLSFDLAIASNDLDENPYDITVSGTAEPAPAPEISVARDGTLIADGGSDAPNALVAGTEQTLTYTVSNEGNLPLSVSGITASNATNVSGSVTFSPTNLTVAANGSQTFTATFTPAAAGTSSFDLAIANDDADENPYDITVSGTADPAPAPEIFVSRDGAEIVFDAIDAQGAVTAGVVQNLTYTISNEGTAPLDVSRIALNGVPINILGAVSISETSFSSIAPEGSETFVVTYTVADADAFQIDLLIFSNDEDESIYGFRVNGTADPAPVPEISVSREGTLIADGGADAQEDLTVGIPRTLTYTVSNDGTAPLNVSGITASGATNITGSVTFSETSFQVATNGSQTFTATFTPADVGDVSFNLAIASDDDDENPYDIAVSGTANPVPVPEISVSRDGNTILDSESDLLVGNIAAGAEQQITYTVSNEGTGLLTVSGITASDAANITGSVSISETSFTVDAGGSQTFTVTVTPTNAGLFTFELAIASDDADENPYDIAFRGAAISPEIAVSRDGETIADGAADALSVGGAASVEQTLTYTVTNDGSALLDVSEITVSGATNIAGPVTLSDTSFSLVPAGSQTLTATFTPAGAGAYAFDLAIVNNDIDENPYDIAVNGTADPAPAPEIEISRNGTVIAARDGTDPLGTVTVGVEQVLTYTISNEGTATLNVTEIGLQFSAVNLLRRPSFSDTSFTIEPGEEETFTATFTVADADDFSFNIFALSNDADEDFYRFTVSGTAEPAPAPEISVARDGTLIADGGSDAPNALVAGTEQTLTYTVSNEGNLPLSVSGITASNATNVSGSVTFSPTNLTVAANGSQTFTATFTPAAAGTSSFDLAIANDDADENPYDITVSGTADPAPAPEIEISRDGNLIADAGTDVLGTVTAGIEQSVVYTISNEGTAPLNVSNIGVNGNPSNILGEVSLSANSFTILPAEAVTLMVTYTVAGADAFRFDLFTSSNDEDEALYNFMVTGTADPAPVPEISVSRDGTLIADGGADAQEDLTVGIPRTLTYTVSNDGTAPLNVSGITASGATNITSSVTFSETSFQVATNGSQTITATFTPADVGDVSFNLEIASDDEDENPYDIAVSGTANPVPVPEISVSRDGTLIADGGIDEQGALTVDATTRVTYTVTNEGTAPLEITAITSTSGSADNPVRAGVDRTSFTVDPNGTETFQVIYTPEQVGEFSFDLAITSNDADENPYDITVSGTVTAPEIAVSRDGTLIADGATDPQGSLSAGSAQTITYTVSNEGSEPLEVSAVTARNPSNITGSVSLSARSFTVAPEASQSIDLTFTPEGAGDFGFELDIASNDVDESPYDIIVSGVATSPEISVARDGDVLADGAADRLDTLRAGIVRTVTYTVSNDGTAPLDVSGITVSGETNITGSVDLSQTSFTVAEGGSASFTATFTPATTNQYSFDLAIASNDLDENPYDVQVQGIAISPDISVTRDGVVIADGATDPQGTLFAGTPQTITYRVENAGSPPLNVSGITASGATNITGPVSFSVTSFDVAGGGSQAVSVTFTPTNAEAFSFNLAIASDDPDENPYTISVSGTADPTPAPEISVARDGTLIADNTTDSQSGLVAGTERTLTYTVINEGNAPLSVSGFAASGATNISGSVTFSPTNFTVAANGSQAFTVTFTPEAAGTASFDLAIANDDADENPYDITISGTADPAPTPDISVSRDGTAFADDATDPQSGLVAGTLRTLTYTVSNEGNAPLTVSEITASGETNISGSVELADTNFTVAANGSADFTATFTPAGAGDLSFDLAIASNDADENPYNITVSGTADAAPAPEISVSRAGVLITDGGTDAHSGSMAGVEQTLTYTVTNDGNAPLNVSGININGMTNVTGSVLLIDSETRFTLAEGGSRTFRVIFTPTNPGTASIDLAIVNNDADENPYDITLESRVIAPEISVSRDGTLIGDDTTDEQTGLVAGAERTLTYTVENDGDAPLNVTGFTASGAINITGSVTLSPENFTVAANDLRTFTATFTPAAAGTSSFDLAIANDDDDENPYDIFVSGTVAPAPAPEISVSRDGTLIGDDTTDAPTGLVADVERTLTYTVLNEGEAPLTVTEVSASGAINITGSVTLSPSNFTVAANGSQTFTATFTPAAAGTSSFDLVIANDDADENPYNIAVSGTADPAPAPEISVSRDGDVIPDGDFDPQGTLTAGTVRTLTYEVENSGNAPLSVSAITVSNATNLTGAVELSSTSFTLQPGAFQTLTATFAPEAAGDFGFELDIASNDTDENPYDISVSGTADPVPVPEISVSRDGTLIADGGTDASSALVAGTEQTLTYTISNEGNLALNVSGITASNARNITGSVVLSETSFTIAEGGSQTFTATFTPEDAGDLSFDLAIANDDDDENPYDIAVTGTAAPAPAPEISVSRDGTAIADGETDTQGSLTAGTERTLTYTVSNEGSAPLSVTGITASGATNITGSVVLSETSFTIAEDGSQTFTATFTPASAGDFGFELDIASNDADENPYDVIVSGTADPAPAPEISVSRDGVVLADGETDSQGTLIEGVTQTLTYTVTNEGSAPLEVSGIATSGEGNLTGSVTLPTTGFTVAVGGSETFEVTFTPAGAGVGAFAFDLAIANNDADENPYDLTISGVANPAPAPEISVARDGTTVADGAADAHGSITAGTARTVTYTVNNEGAELLEVTEITTSGETNLTGSVTLSRTDFTVAEGGSETFEVTYTPTDAAAFSFDLDIESNDADESPYDIAVSGTATAPEIDVSRDGTAVADGDTDAQGSAITAGAEYNLTYMIENAGSAPLTVTEITASGATNITGAIGLSATGFTVAPGASQAIEVTYTPTHADDFSFDLAITNNDDDESIYNIVVNGTAIEPDISVEILVTPSELTIQEGSAGSYQVKLSRSPMREVVVTPQSDNGDVTTGVSRLVFDANNWDAFQLVSVNTATDSDAEDDTARIRHTLTGGDVIATTQGLVTVTVREEDPILRPIGGYLATRATTLLSNQPELIRFLKHGNAADGPSGQLNIDAEDGRFSLDGGFAHNGIWGDITGAYTRTDASDTRYVFGALGAHRQFSDQFLAGLMFQFDHADDELHGSSGEIEGTGWLSGPYFAARHSTQPLYFEGRFLYGQTRNDIDFLDPDLGARRGSFDTERWLAQSRMEGEVELDPNTGARLIPYADASWIEDRAKSFTDQLGIHVPGQAVRIRQLELGSDIEVPILLDKGELTFTGGLGLIQSDQTGEYVNLIPRGRGRAEFGFGYRPTNSTLLEFKTFHDGIGSPDYKGYGLSLTGAIKY